MSEDWPSVLVKAQISARKCFVNLDRIYSSCERALARESNRRYHSLSLALGPADGGQNCGPDGQGVPGGIPVPGSRGAHAPDANLCDVIEGMFDGVTFSPFEKHAAYVGMSTPKKYDYREYDILEGKEPPPDAPSDAHGELLVSLAEIGADVFSAEPELEPLRNPFASIGDLDDEEYEAIASAAGRVPDVGEAGGGAKGAVERPPRPAGGGKPAPSGTPFMTELPAAPGAG